MDFEFGKQAYLSAQNTSICRSYLKNKILGQGQGGHKVQPADILVYFEELERGPNAEIGTKDIFEIASG